MQGLVFDGLGGQPRLLPRLLPDSFDDPLALLQVLLLLRVIGHL